MKFVLDVCFGSHAGVTLYRLHQFKNPSVTSIGRRQGSWDPKVVPALTQQQQFKNPEEQGKEIDAANVRQTRK